MEWTFCLAAYSRQMARRGLSPISQRTNLHIVCRFARWARPRRPFTLADIDLEAWNAQRLGEVSPASVKAEILGLRAFFRFLRPGDNPVLALPFPRVALRPPVYLAHDALERLLLAPLSLSAFPERDRLVLSIMAYAGLRRSEVSRLKLEDLNIEEGTIWIDRGKSKEGRLLFICPGLRTALGDYMRVRPETSCPQLFLNRWGKPLAPSTIYNMTKFMAAGAQLHKKVSPHKLRHTFATEMVDRGVNLLIIKKALGHRDIKTTERYAHVRDSTLRAAMEAAGR